jgi:predicted DNA-binding ribbon-helix-helix protein
MKKASTLETYKWRGDNYYFLSIRLDKQFWIRLKEKAAEMDLPTSTYAKQLIEKAIPNK